MTSERFPPEVLHARIERFAPQISTYREGRARLFSDLRAALAARSTAEPSSSENKDEIDAYSRVLEFINQAHVLFAGPAARQREKEQHLRRKQYWATRRRIEGTLQRMLREESILRRLDYDFYAPEELDCPHGRTRRECERLYDRRETLRLLQADPIARYVRKHLERLQREDGHLLQRPASDFCVPRPGLFANPPPPRKGRRLIALYGFLFDSVGRVLEKHELTREKAADYVARILVYCLNCGRQGTDPGDEVARLAENLHRMWRTHKATRPAVDWPLKPWTSGSSR